MGSQTKKIRRRKFALVRANVGGLIASSRSKHLAAGGCWFDGSDNSINWLTQTVPDAERFRVIARCISHPRTEQNDRRDIERQMRNIHSQTDGDAVEHWTLYVSANPWGTDLATSEDWEGIYGLVERLSYDTGETRQRELEPVECSDGSLRIAAFTWHSDATDVEPAVRRQLQRQLDGMVERMSAPVPPPTPLRPATKKL